MLLAGMGRIERHKLSEYFAPSVNFLLSVLHTWKGLPVFVIECDVGKIFTSSPEVVLML